VNPLFLASGHHWSPDQGPKSGHFFAIRSGFNVPDKFKHSFTFSSIGFTETNP
jgi:hypothetical protein